MLSSNLNRIPNLDLSADAATAPILMEHVLLAAIQVVTTGASADGSFKLQGSCDQGGDPFGVDVVNWNDVLNSSSVVAGPGIITWNLNDIGYKWLRVVFTYTSGTGSAAIDIQTKGA